MVKRWEHANEYTRSLETFYQAQRDQRRADKFRSDLLELLSHNGIPWSSVDVETLEDGSLEIYAPDPLIWYVLSALGHHDGITGRLRTTAAPDGLPVIVVREG